MPDPLVTIYDAVDVPAIPSTAEVVLAYIDGIYVTYPAVRFRFPNATILTTTTSGTHPADLCDVESGDATPEIAAQGLRNGLYALRTLYSDLSTKPALDKACEGLEWFWFAANPTGIPHLAPGSVATQWAWGSLGQAPGNFDISVGLASWLDPTPPGPPPPPPTEEDMPLYCTNSAKTGFVVAADLSHKQGIPDGQDAGALLASGLYKVVQLSDEMLALIPG